MPQVSVCMATYNGEKFIRRQLQSILNQLKEDDEIIISDDSSTDNTIQIIREFNDSRIRVLDKQIFRSPMLNFENALKHATGKYIFLSDQDDVWDPDKVSATLPLLSQYDLVLTDCRLINEKGDIIVDSFFRQRQSNAGFWRNLYKNSYIGCCMAFRRDVLSYSLPFPPTVHMHDWWIGLLTEAKGRVYFYPKPMISYVRHGGNASPTGEVGTGYGLGKQLKNRWFLLVQIAKRLLR